MSDPTEAIRRVMVAEINAVEGSREHMESLHGKVWDTQQLREDFEVTGFMAPFVGVTRKVDNMAGVMTFQHNPRFYFEFSEN